MSSSLSSPSIKSIDELIPDYQPLSETTQGSEVQFLGLSWKIWLIILLGFALLGINIFNYLAQGTDAVASLLKPVLSFFGLTAKQIVNISAVGTKAGVDAVASASSNALEKIVDKTETEKNNKWAEDSLAKALADSKAKVTPDTTNDITPYSKPSQAGWCLVGEDENLNRTCAKVGANDTCMSGDIFPSQAICMNPTLRV